jgi:hypothetical protein
MLPLLVFLLVFVPCQAARSPDRPRAKDVREVERIEREEGSLGWRGLRLGMSVIEVEEALGERLPLSEVPRTDVGCEAAYGTTVRHKNLSLGLGFDRPGRGGRLREITLILPVPARDELVSAVKDRFPGIRYVPPQGAPDLLEGDASEPLFRTTTGDLIFVNPGVGVSFGIVCGVEPVAEGTPKGS